ncbi:DotG/IcmE/VirB10 family protein [Neisseria elongata]
MSNNELNKDPFADEEVLPPPKAGNEEVVKPGSGYEQKIANLRQTFSQGPGLYALVASGIIIVVFLGLGWYGISSTRQAAANLEGGGVVDQPSVPDKDKAENTAVSPEELKRQQQAAAEEAQRAIEQGSGYQTSFNPNIAANGPAAGTDGASFDISGGEPAAKAASETGTAEPNDTAEKQAEEERERRRLEEERKAAEEERQRLDAEYQQALARRKQKIDRDEDIVMAQIEKLQERPNNTSSYSTTVSYLPTPGGQQTAFPAGGAAVGRESGSYPALGNVPANVPAGSNTACMPVFKTGNTAYAVLDYEVNTDVGTDAIATVVGGSYNGSKLIGGVSLGNGGLALKFTRLAPQDGRETLNIDAVAIPPGSSRSGVATSVNRHTVGRYASLIFSGALRGWGQAAGQRIGSATQLNNGTTVVQTQEASNRQIAGSIAGEVGGELSSEIRQGFDRPPTYKIARGTGIALFFMNDVCAR